MLKFHFHLLCAEEMLLLACAHGIKQCQEQGCKELIRSLGREEQSNPSEVELTQEQRCPRDLAQPMALHKLCSD